MPTEFERLIQAAAAEADTAGSVEASTSQHGDPAAAPPRRRIAAIGLAFLGLAGVALIGGGAVMSGLTPIAAPSSSPPETQPQQAVEPVVVESKTAEEKSGVRGPDTAWIARTSEATGIPERALRAYASAALTMADERPSCGIGWNTIAAIGHVESAHGSINGATLHDDGRATPRIVGVALDGSRFNAIPDTDGGRLDGDTQWDRAVGPMQFIPETWGVYGRDGNGDGVADPDQIDDAALSAATLLCTEGGDLRVAENWITAVNAYNPSVAYNNDVADAADYYGGFA